MADCHKSAKYEPCRPPRTNQLTVGLRVLSCQFTLATGTAGSSDGCNLPLEGRVIAHPTPASQIRMSDQLEVVTRGIEQIDPFPAMLMVDLSGT